VKNYLSQINKLFENRVRLAVMSLLMVEEWLDFGRLKETLDLTDGNLSSHINKLEGAGYVEVRKRFVGKKPQTSYRATAKGRKAFQDHLDALENIIRGGN